MTAHLTDAELRAFASGALAPGDLLRADDHLSECERCRAAAARVNDASAPIADMRAQLNHATVHVSEEDLVLLVQERLPADARDETLRHLAECATCAAQADDLRRWTAGRVERTHWSRVAIAAAVLVAVLVPAAFWQLRHRSPAAAPASLVGENALPASDLARVRAAVNAGVGSLPAFSTEIAPARETLMGPSTPRDAFNLIAPMGTATVSDHPRFRWQSLDRADGYVVTVVDEQANVVARSARIDATEWAPIEALVRDRTYFWQVTAFRGAETITAPKPPASAARFHVIDAPAAELLQQMEARFAQSHVLLGLLYMENGVVDTAAVHLRQVPATDEHADLARRSLEKLAPFER